MDFHAFLSIRCSFRIIEDFVFPLAGPQPGQLNDIVKTAGIGRDKTLLQPK